MSKLLMTLTSNKVLAHDLRPSIMEIYDDKVVYKDRAGIIGGEEAVINYDQIAEVNQYQGLVDSKLEIINEGGADDIIIEHVLNDPATQAKQLIQAKSREAHADTKTIPEPVNEVEELEKLSQLHEQGQLSDAEFEDEKQKLLGS